MLSHKGGVGKTSIAVNLGCHLAKIGKNVIILDNDFSGPSLVTFFQKNISVNWLNDYLMTGEDLDHCLQDVSPLLNLPGRLYIGFADPTPERIQSIIRIDQKTSIAMLRHLIALKKAVRSPPYDIDYLIVDCSPGTGYSTVNVILTTDSSLFVVKLSNADLYGTSQMISGLYTQLKNRTLVLANLIPSNVLVSGNLSLIEQLIEKRFTQEVGDKVVEFLGWIPTDLELQTIEFNEAVKSLKQEPSQRNIFTLHNPSHIFSKILIDLIPALFGEEVH
ncbi:MAG: MinD/ParA family protein [Candidatus Heimdallarchaeota archaeon]